MFKNIILFKLIALTLFSCKEKEEWCELDVVATAYNSTKWQTDGNPYHTAWGDTLKASVKSIAVSKDLIKLGLTRNTKVKIEDLEGIYIVNDKMHAKWKNRIDIYFGDDIKAAREWGRKKVKIQYLLNK
ncbi:MAG: 3D domain-containing protein [Flavobacteriaceae bacterium]|nr:3D domain-containing protein [Flavobacteriaceae bacterium]